MGRKRESAKAETEYAENTEDREELLRKLRIAIRSEIETRAEAEETSSEPGKDATSSRFPAMADNISNLLWKVLLQYQKEPFYTVKGLEFTYYIKGNELFVSRKDKSITRASVEVALQKAMELGLVVSGPKKLTSFGASYLYPIFLKLEIIRPRS